MKSIPVSLQILAVSAGLFGLVACDSKPAAPAAPAGGTSAAASAAPTEEEAVATLKKHLEEIKGLKEAGDAAQKTNPMGMLPMMRTMMTKLASLPTDGLPADLKAGMEKAKGLFKKVEGIIIPAFKDIPADEDGIKKWAAELQADPSKAAGIMAAMGTVGPAMEALTPEKDALKAELDPLFKKYDLPADFLKD